MPSPLLTTKNARRNTAPMLKIAKPCTIAPDSSELRSAEPLFAASTEAVDAAASVSELSTDPNIVVGSNFRHPHGGDLDSQVAVRRKSIYERVSSVASRVLRLGSITALPVSMSVSPDEFDVESQQSRRRAQWQTSDCTVYRKSQLADDGHDADLSEEESSLTDSSGVCLPQDGSETESAMGDEDFGDEQDECDEQKYGHRAPTTWKTKDSGAVLSFTDTDTSDDVSNDISFHGDAFSIDASDISSSLASCRSTGSRIDTFDSENGMKLIADADTKAVEDRKFSLFANQRQHARRGTELGIEEF